MTSVWPCPTLLCVNFGPESLLVRQNALSGRSHPDSPIPSIIGIGYSVHGFTLHYLAVPPRTLLACLLARPGQAKLANSQLLQHSSTLERPISNHTSAKSTGSPPHTLPLLRSNPTTFEAGAAIDKGRV